MANRIDAEQLLAMDRKQLQKLCKDQGLKGANAKNSELIEKLAVKLLITLSSGASEPEVKDPTKATSTSNKTAKATTNKKRRRNELRSDEGELSDAVVITKPGKKSATASRMETEEDGGDATETEDVAHILTEKTNAVEGSKKTAKKPTKSTKTASKPVEEEDCSIPTSEPNFDDSDHEVEEDAHPPTMTTKRKTDVVQEAPTTMKPTEKPKIGPKQVQAQKTPRLPSAVAPLPEDSDDEMRLGTPEALAVAKIRPGLAKERKSGGSGEGESGKAGKSVAKPKKRVETSSDSAGRQRTTSTESDQQIAASSFNDAQIKSLKDEISTLRSTISGLSSNFESSQRAIKDLMAKFDDQQGEISELKARVGQQNRSPEWKAIDSFVEQRIQTFRERLDGQHREWLTGLWNDFETRAEKRCRTIVDDRVEKMLTQADKAALEERMDGVEELVYDLMDEQKLQQNAEESTRKSNKSPGSVRKDAGTPTVDRSTVGSSSVRGDEFVYTKTPLLASHLASPVRNPPASVRSPSTQSPRSRLGQTPQPSLPSIAAASKQAQADIDLKESIPATTLFKTGGGSPRPKEPSAVVESVHGRGSQSSPRKASNPVGNSPLPSTHLNLPGTPASVATPKSVHGQSPRHLTPGISSAIKGKAPVSATPGRKVQFVESSMEALRLSSPAYARSTVGQQSPGPVSASEDPSLASPSVVAPSPRTSSVSQDPRAVQQSTFVPRNASSNRRETIALAAAPASSNVATALPSHILKQIASSAPSRSRSSDFGSTPGKPPHSPQSANVKLVSPRSPKVATPLPQPSPKFTEETSVRSPSSRGAPGSSAKGSVARPGKRPLNDDTSDTSLLVADVIGERGGIENRDIKHVRKMRRIASNDDEADATKGLAGMANKEDETPMTFDDNSFERSSFMDVPPALSLMDMQATEFKPASTSTPNAPRQVMNSSFNFTYEPGTGGKGSQEEGGSRSLYPKLPPPPSPIKY